MQLQILMRHKRILGGLVLATVAVAAAVLLLPAESPAPASAPAGKGAGSSAARAAGGPLAALPTREPLGKLRGELFGFPPARAPQQAAARAAPPPAPTPPPMPYRLAGQVVHDGAAHVVLARDERVTTVREGDKLDEDYRVESIRPDGVTLVYLPLGAREELPVLGSLRLETRAPAVALAAAAAPEPAAAAESRSAQLRWDGPDHVKAGNSFDVTLKLTSDQPVRSSPLQLNYDAKLLQPVSVRAGGFFADGSFTYRVNPGGSIFVGASGAGAAAADAEFLVVTFKPIRSGAAQLTLSSVVLQGDAGRAIAHDAPAAFRTAIIP
jgi:hypothetical protein